MNRSFNKSQSLRYLDCSAVEVKSKYGAEFRRFSVDRFKPGKFEEFYKLILNIHRITSMEVMIGYADIHGDLLPINNDDNFCKAVSTAHPLLRIFIQRQEEVDYSNFGTNTLTRRKKAVVTLRNDANRKRPHIRIGMPQDFRPVSSIIDVDILPESHRRVRLYRHGSDKPLGFYIRDGVSVRVSPQGVEKVPGVFISRLVRGGLAESTGLLGVNDEILEVNGIEVEGKSLDQVTDMMVANSHNLIVTVKPANQRNNVVRGSKASGNSSGSGFSHDSTPSPASQYVSHYSNSTAEGESDEDGDLIIESDSLPPYLPADHFANGDGGGGLGNASSSSSAAAAMGLRPLPQSASLHSSSLSDSKASLSSLNTPTHNGSPAGASSSQESMREDGNVITL